MDIDRKAIRSEINRVIDNAIYWFGYCVIYKQKKSATFPSNRFLKNLYTMKNYSIRLNQLRTRSFYIFHRPFSNEKELKRHRKAFG